MQDANPTAYVVTLRPTGDASAATVSSAADVLRERLSAAGVADVSVTVTDETVTVRASENVRDRLEDGLADVGRVRIVVEYPENGSSRERVLVGPDGFETVGSASERRGRYTLPVTMTDSARTNFTSGLRETGFLGPGVGACGSADASYCLVTVADGRDVFRASMSAGLADTIRNGDFDGQFLFSVENRTTARSLSVWLRTGPLPTDLSVESVERVTGTGTTDGTASSTATTAAERDDVATDTTAGTGPGFGVVVALLAVLATFGFDRFVGRS
jgi:preprotein translocase subunit SecD